MYIKRKLLADWNLVCDMSQGRGVKQSTIQELRGGMDNLYYMLQCKCDIITFTEAGCILDKDHENFCTNEYHFQCVCGSNVPDIEANLKIFFKPH